MQIVVRGSGLPLVMLHGWAMHGGVFAPLVERLQARFQLHLVDLPGHGLSADSPTPLVLDAIARELACRVPRALWLGWSLGGLVALHAAQAYAENVRGLVMLAASARFVRGPGWSHAMDESVFLRFAADLESDYAGTIDRFLLLEAHGSEHGREEARRLRADVFAHGKPSATRLVEGLALLQHSDLRAGLPTLSVPSLWIAGRRDRLVSPASMQAAADMTPAARFLRVEHGGHAPFLTYTDEIASAIQDFSQDIPA